LQKILVPANTIRERGLFCPVGLDGALQVGIGGMQVIVARRQLRIVDAERPKRYAGVFRFLEL
jgi:hypothetical protein